MNYGRAFSGVDDAVSNRVAKAAPRDGIVFVTTDYGGFVWRNDPWPKEGPIFVRDRGAKNGEVLRSLPGRRAFRQDGERIVSMEREPAR